MKTYVFIIRRICNITGAQQYVYNKVNYLENKGWRVLVFSSIHGTILIHKFEEYKEYIIPTLYFSPSVFRKGQVKSTINRILAEIGDCQGDDCVIESDSLPRAIWGELVASRLNCRHLAFFMQEWHHYDNEMKSFLRFKYDRHELAGITKDSIHQMFGDDNVEARDDTRIAAYCNNVIDNCEDKYSQLLDDKADYTFGSIGRLNKPCVPAIVDGFCSYANLHHDKRINIVMIGGSLVRGKMEYVRQRLTKCGNVNLVLTGDVYPIPLAFAKRIDVFVSTAGSANATFLAGFPTIKLNPETGVPVGILGLDDMTGKSMYDSSSEMTIEGCIDRSIKNRDMIEYRGDLGDNYNKEMYNEFERQLSFVLYSTKNEYYNYKMLLRLKTPRHPKSALHRVLGYLFGGTGLEIIRKMSGKI